MQKIPAVQQRFLIDIQRLLATLLLRDVADPRFSGVSITRVERSGKQLVTVWVYRGNGCDAAICMSALERMTPHFQHELRRAMDKRKLPNLRFRWDENFEKSGAVMQMLRDLERP
ncbi:MAG: ribosome-binding factor A [Mariprofundus sp.]|nr:ribosome-binding factor A [Mariprofundus sp.]